MGLLHPVEGELTIDGKLLKKEDMRAWQGNIAHVPQNLYLYDKELLQKI